MSRERDPAGEPQRLMIPDEVHAGRALLTAVHQGLGKVIYGQDRVLDLVVVALAARGHVLLEGLPGLGKTELVKALATLLGLTFRRVQFTPDLLPSDITGGPILQEQDGKRVLVFHKGPLFGNLVLADEINRASPKTQAAMLEAMQERRVTVLGTTHALPLPFFVLATQNPIELEGTYPLPEAQLDRFLFKIEVPNVGPEVLTQILRERRRGEPPPLTTVLDLGQLQALFAAVDRVFLPEPIAHYIGRLVSASHARDPACPATVRGLVRYGASPRAAIALAEAGRAHALLHGRPNVDFDDVGAIAHAVLAHRLVLEHGAKLEGITAAEVVRRLVAAIEPTGAPLPKEVFQAGG